MQSSNKPSEYTERFASALATNLTRLKAVNHPVIGAAYWTPEVREAIRQTMEQCQDVTRMQVAQALKVDYSRVTAVHKDFLSKLNSETR